MSKKKTINEFISEANSVHDNRYDYSKSDYKTNRDKIEIVCPEHGSFYQTPYKHLIGQGCPKCCKTLKLSVHDFISKARNVHGEKYDYSKVDYINNVTKVSIICPEHGEFLQDPHNHLKGKGCPECSKLISKPKRFTTEEFVLELKSVHGDKYDYSLVEYNGMNNKIKIICPEHGEFEQSAYAHLNGSICPKCSNDINGLKKRLTKDDFISKAKIIHGDKYDYSKVDYITSKNKVVIICKKHGEFEQTPDKHLSGNGCPKCNNPYSKDEVEIYDFVKSICADAEQHNREILDGKEIDIYIPSKKIGIEYNGLYWHTLSKNDKNYHLNKTLKCIEKGVRLIQIFEDEYKSCKEIVLSKIRYLLGASDTLRIGARKCTIKQINADTAREFMNKNHIQGFGSASYHIGAFFNNELVSVMSFKKENEVWELVRFSTDINKSVQGIGGKLFSYFIKTQNPSEVKSFADRRWTINEENNVYIKLGFKFDCYTKPEYRYYNPNDGFVRNHKFGFRKEKLSKKYNLPITMTESEMTNFLGYSKIYDCGLIRYVWKKEGV